MKNFEVNSLGLMELDAREMISFDGGNRFRTIVKIADQILKYVGYYDALNDAKNGFIDGFNSK